MKTIKDHISTLFMGVCTSLLALLGFGCSSDPGETPSMYGMPVSDFEIKGSVTDEEQHPINGAKIKLILDPELPSDDANHKDISGVTNSMGYYSVSFRGYWPEIKIVCIPKETYLLSDSVIINFDQWKDNVDFVLKYKNGADTK